jgi:hypothetical protein
MLCFKTHHWVSTSICQQRNEEAEREREREREREPGSACYGAEQEGLDMIRKG